MLKKDHWFKFYYHRILVSCAGWKDDEFGAFVKLLIHQFDKGYVPSNESELKRLITSFKKNWPLLSTKFKEGEDGNLYNDVMAKVREERIMKGEKNAEVGRLGGRPKKNRTETESKPNGFKKETHIYSYSVSNSKKEDESVREETVELPEAGFFTDNLPEDLRLHEMEVGKSIEYIAIKTGTRLENSEVEKQWEAFKIRQFQKHEWYNSHADLISHFRDSLKLEIQKNARGKSDRPVNGKSSKSAGAIELSGEFDELLTSYGKGPGSQDH